MIKTIIDFILHLDTYLISLVQSYGIFAYPLLFLVIFMETGFVLTPFLPGDSLIFISGTFAATGALNVYLLFLILSIAAILGDTANYWIGYFFGEKVFSRFIKKDYIKRTKLFFNKYGKKTIVIARFVPIIRTFAPFVAGIGKMKYSTFLSYNIIGGITWVGLFLFSGYFFGNISYVKNNLTLVTVLIIFISFIPVIMEYIKHRRESKKKKSKRK